MSSDLVSTHLSHNGGDDHTNTQIQNRLTEQLNHIDPGGTARLRAEEPIGGIAGVAKTVRGVFGTPDAPDAENIANHLIGETYMEKIKELFNKLYQDLRKRQDVLSKDHSTISAQIRPMNLTTDTKRNSQMYNPSRGGTPVSEKRHPTSRFSPRGPSGTPGPYSVSGSPFQ